MMENIKFDRQDAILLMTAFLTAAALRAWLLWKDVVPFNADEAIVALMARHILKGERPIFFYGQAYMGSLDAWLVAGGFWLLGQKVWVMRVVQGVLYYGTLITTFYLGRAVFGSYKVGVLATWLAAIPTVNVMLYTTVSLGGYNEAILFGNLILLGVIRIVEMARLGLQSAIGLYLAWGLTVGLGLWTSDMTLVYSLPAACYLILQLAKMGEMKKVRGWFGLTLILIGCGLGLLPSILYSTTQARELLIFELVKKLFANRDLATYLIQIKDHFVNLILLGSTVVLGIRPPWSVKWLGLPLLPFALMIWLGILGFWLKEFLYHRRASPKVILLIGAIFILLASFIVTPFGADPSGRYFLPLFILMGLFAAQSIQEWREKIGLWSYGLVVVLLGYNLWGIVQSASHFPPGLTTQLDPTTQIDWRDINKLMTFLKSNGERYGYTNYWIAYPLAFLSGEELIFVPGLPYHRDFHFNPGDNRYPYYSNVVNNSERVAYITARNPVLDAFLRSHFSESGLRWQEEAIGDFHIYYNLSKPVRPSELGIKGFNEP